MSDKKQYGLILYTDGGARPIKYKDDPKRAGWGLHGYLCSSEVPKKGTGHPMHVPTSIGYLTKTTAQQHPEAAVTPLFYIDGVGSFEENSTNNIAELRAAIEALRIACRFSNLDIRKNPDASNAQLTLGDTAASEYWDVKDPKTATFEDYTVADLSYLKVYADSKYVVEGFNDYLWQWRNNGWKKADGVEPKNLELWKEIEHYATLLRHAHREGQPNTYVSFEWVKAHTDNDKTIEMVLGNVIADMLATVGVYHALHHQTIAEIDYTKSDGYWKSDVERHPFLNLPLLHFSDTFDANSNIFFLATRTKVTEKDKRKSSTAKISLDPDASYALVQIDEVDETIRTVANHHRRCCINENTLSVMYLDDVFNASQNHLIEKFQEFTLRNVGQEKTEIQSSLDRLLTSEHFPPGNAYKVIEMSNILAKFLREAVPEGCVETDLTSVFYDRETKKEVERYTLKPDFKVGMSGFKVMAKYRLPSETADGETELILRFGIDLPDRNHIKRMESMKPKVTLLTYIEGSHQLRYVIRIDTLSARGVWAAWYSNLKLIRKDR